MKDGKRDKSLQFEQALEQLEKLVEKIEGGKMSLEESLQSFEDGMKLTRLCEQKLGEAKRKVEILVKPGSGKDKVVDFLEKE